MEIIEKYWKRLAVGAGIVVLILLMSDFSNRMAELNRLTNQRERIAAEATALLQTQQVLETQIASVSSDAAVEEWAYEDGKLVREGEVLVVPIPSGDQSPTPTVVPTEQAQASASNWEIWKAFFFDE